MRRYLRHEGIKGMHWGERNGPPYPLAPYKRSKEELRLNKPSKSAKERYVDANYKEVDSINIVDGEPKDHVGKAKKASENINNIAKSGSNATQSAARVSEYKAKQAQMSEKEKLQSKAKKMSDDELRARISRLELERRYVDLESSSITAGKDYLKEKELLEMKTLQLNNLATAALVVGTVAPIIAPVAGKVAKKVLKR